MAKEFEMTTLPQFDRKRHGGLYDRGRADSYYRRGINPHWWPEGTNKGQKVTDLTKEEIAEYVAGFRSNEAEEDWKDWGEDYDYGDDN